jgi:hypothetical protein
MLTVDGPLACGTLAIGLLDVTGLLAGRGTDAAGVLVLKSVAVPHERRQSDGCAGAAIVVLVVGVLAGAAVLGNG